MSDAAQQRCSAQLRPVEGGCRGCVTSLTVSSLSELGIKGQNLNVQLKTCQQTCFGCLAKVFMSTKKTVWGLIVLNILLDVRFL